jgi:hypothetical protein
MVQNNQIDFPKSLGKDMIFRMTRLETKLVRGFEELGVDISADEWIYLNDKERIVHLDTLGRSISVILNKMKELGASHIGEEYEIHFKNNFSGTLVFNVEKGD